MESTDEKLVLIKITVPVGSSALDEMREAKETAECQVLKISPVYDSCIKSSPLITELHCYKERIAIGQLFLLVF